MKSYSNLFIHSLKRWGVLTLLLFIPFQVDWACGPYVDEGYTFHFIDRAILGEELRSDMILEHLASDYIYYDRLEDAAMNNIQEWQKSVCEDAPIEDVQAAIYGFSKKDYEDLLQNIRVDHMPVPYHMTRNAFVSYLHQNKCQGTVEYLIFAKSCEPYVQALDTWNNEQRDIEAMQALIQVGLKAFKKSKSDYMRLRYAYQLIRLAHYTRNSKQALELYDFLMPKLDVPTFDGKKSLIYYWILSLKAGALRNIKQYPEASYLFSKVYANCPELQDSALRSFLIKSESEWKACMAFCTANSERALLHAMRAYEKGSKALNAMRAIYTLDPQSKYLDILLIKELEELEEDLIGHTFNRSQNNPRSGIQAYAIDLRAFAQTVIAEKKVAQLDLWKASEAYILLLSGEKRAASIALQKLAIEVKDEALAEQVDAFILAQQIDEMQEINDASEALAYDIIRDNKTYRSNVYFARFLGDKLHDLYQKHGDTGKAYLCHNTYHDLKVEQPEQVIKDLAALVERGQLNDLEKVLLEQGADQVMHDEIFDLLAVHYMQIGNFEAALDAYQKIPRTNWDQFGVFDPFRATIIDCLSCPHSKDTIDLFNRGEFIEEILDLQFKAKAEEDHAGYYLKIGVGLYNSSYYGHSWQVMDYYRSVADWAGKRPDPNNKEFKDLSLAAYYFDMARKTAIDPEQAAKACYMAAKCTLIDYYHSSAYEAPACCNNIPYIPEEYGKYYDLMLDLYGKTTFYEKIITECQFFRAYAYR